jgi:hypothetical protein
MSQDIYYGLTAHDFEKDDGAEKEAALRHKLTPEFMETLEEAAQLCGWGVDFIEVASFVKWCRDVRDAK